MKIRSLIIILMVVLTMASCIKDDTSTPKPPTYFRLEVPKPKYEKYEGNQKQPFSFEVPDYTEAELEIGSKDATLTSIKGSENWFNLNFPKYGYKLYVTYLPIKSDTMMPYLVNDAYRFITEHNKISSGVIEKEYINKDAKVYGVVFEIKGKDVASPYQFFLTDSTNHFIRGALYFNNKPNNDSLAPVIDRITQDMNHLISTFNWR